jgi:hypothetical protein
VSCRVVSCRVVSCRVVSCRVVSCVICHVSLTRDGRCRTCRRARSSCGSRARRRASPRRRPTR